MRIAFQDGQNALIAMLRQQLDRACQDEGKGEGHHGHCVGDITVIYYS